MILPAGAGTPGHSRFIGMFRAGIWRPSFGGNNIPQLLQRHLLLLLLRLQAAVQGVRKGVELIDLRHGFPRSSLHEERNGRTAARSDGCSELDVETVEAG